MIIKKYVCSQLHVILNCNPLSYSGVLILRVSLLYIIHGPPVFRLCRLLANPCFLPAPTLLDFRELQCLACYLAYLMSWAKKMARDAKTEIILEKQMMFCI